MRGRCQEFSDLVSVTFTPASVFSETRYSKCRTVQTRSKNVAEMWGLSPGLLSHSLPFKKVTMQSVGTSRFEEYSLLGTWE